MLLAPPPHKSGDLELVIDAATGIELRIANAQHGFTEELTVLEVDIDLDDSVFSYDGPVDDSEARDRAREIEATDYWHRHLPPLPTYWPIGLGHHVNSGDVETGWFVLELAVPHQSPAHPNWAQLARGPKGSELNLGYRRAEAIVHRWETERWQWALMLAPPGLPDGEVAKVIASIRDA